MCFFLHNFYSWLFIFIWNKTRLRVFPVIWGLKPQTVRAAPPFPSASKFSQCFFIRPAVNGFRYGVQNCARFWFLSRRLTHLPPKTSKNNNNNKTRKAGNSSSWNDHNKVAQFAPNEKLTSAGELGHRRTVDNWNVEVAALETNRNTVRLSGTRKLCN